MRTVERSEELRPVTGTADAALPLPPTSYRLEPHGIGELLDTALDVLRERFVWLVGVAFVLLLCAQSANEGLRQWAERSGWAAQGDRAQIKLGLAQMGIALAGSQILVAAVSRLTYAVLEGRPMRAGALLHWLVRRIWPVFATTLLTALLSFAGLFACILPGLICYWKCLLAPSVAALENLGPTKAINRSWWLTRGLFWPGFATLLLGVLFLLPFHLAGGLEDEQTRAKLFNTLSVDPTSALARWVVLVLGAALGSIGAAYQAVLTTIFYVETRIRREAFDLNIQLDRLSVANARAEESPAPSYSGTNWEGLA